MRNSIIFWLLFVTLTICSIFTLVDTSRTATIEGRFAKYITYTDDQWAYLCAADGSRMLDSCMVTNRSFTLMGDIPEKNYPCRITFSKLKIEPEFLLNPKQRVALNITAEVEMYSQFALAILAVRDSLMRLQADSLPRAYSEIIPEVPVFLSTDITSELQVWSDKQYSGEKAL